MFRQKTLLILGAGASYELGLPTGNALKQEISEILKVHPERDHLMDLQPRHDKITDALNHVVRHGTADGSTFKKAELLYACSRISASIPLARSIDNYLHSNKDSKAIELCGKLGIAYTILQAEADCLLKTEKAAAPFQVDFSALKDSWYSRFGSLLFESSFDDMKEALKNLTVIVFNYDRCFEHFLYHAIITYYGREPNEAADVVKNMAIYHPYGMVGHLPWTGEPLTAEFGEKAEGGKLVQLAGNIKTYTEGVDRRSSEIQAIHEAIRQATTVVFLGFGFIGLNMDLLLADDGETMNTNKTVYLTSKGISDPDMRRVWKRITEQLWNPGMEVGDQWTCVELFDQNTFSLGESL
ncbi:hypothetical protein [Mesorhizobium sp. WSM3873]|uniref:hypothetical protein n=1 Tax=Mesorhizobium sp. WSM3873 TaxID=1854056 RepID=UPI0008017D64|nr:hypothetical protein [Mesorhizobium sp. WSM3873]OBQ83555.1 hypothetical protein A9K71_23605 [Mesorhizobium sp. WSM3873]